MTDIQKFQEFFKSFGIETIIRDVSGDDKIKPIKTMSLVVDDIKVREEYDCHSIDFNEDGSLKYILFYT